MTVINHWWGVPWPLPINLKRVNWHAWHLYVTHQKDSQETYSTQSAGTGSISSGTAVCLFVVLLISTSHLIVNTYKCVPNRIANDQSDASLMLQ